MGTLPEGKVVVMWVDDEPGLLRVVERLADDQTEMVTAPSALHALQVLERRRVDIVVSDEHMPGMCGVRLLETISQKWPETIRVLITGQPDPALFRRSVNGASVERILVKPIDTNTLREELGALVNDCLARRSTPVPAP